MSDTLIEACQGTQRDRSMHSYARVKFYKVVTETCITLAPLVHRICKPTIKRVIKAVRQNKSKGYRLQVNMNCQWGEI